jgi:hypothetical protein
MANESKGPISWAGPALICIGVLHTVVMVALFHQTYIEILSAGMWNTIHESAQPMWAAAAWTLIFGFMLIFAGLLLPKNRTPVSKPAAVCFLLIIAFGIVLMPTGGFWLGLPVVAGLLIRG